jgi:hypothetical protein
MIPPSQRRTGGAFGVSDLQRTRLLRRRLIDHRRLFRRMESETAHSTHHIRSEIAAFSLQLEDTDVPAASLVSRVRCVHIKTTLQEPTYARY